MLGEADLRLGGELADRQHLGELRRRMFRWDMLSVAGIVLAGYNVCRHFAAVRSGTVQHRGRDSALHTKCRSRAVPRCAECCCLMS